VTPTEISVAIGNATQTIERLNKFEEWLETSQQLAAITDIGPRTPKDAMRIVLEKYREARYGNTGRPG
jgi:hypothetical protein